MKALIITIPDCGKYKRVMGSVFNSYLVVQVVKSTAENWEPLFSHWPSILL